MVPKLDFSKLDKSPELAKGSNQTPCKDDERSSSKAKPPLPPSRRANLSPESKSELSYRVIDHMTPRSECSECSEWSEGRPRLTPRETMSPCEMGQDRTPSSQAGTLATPTTQTSNPTPRTQGARDTAKWIAEQEVLPVLLQEADEGLSLRAVIEWLWHIPAGEGDMRKYATALYQGGLDSKHAWLTTNTEQLMSLGVIEAHAYRIMRAVTYKGGPDPNHQGRSDGLREGFSPSEAEPHQEHPPREVAQLSLEVAKLREQINEHEIKLCSISPNSSPETKHVSMPKLAGTPQPSKTPIERFDARGTTRNCKIGNACGTCQIS